MRKTKEKQIVVRIETVPHPHPERVIDMLAQMVLNQIKKEESNHES